MTSPTSCRSSRSGWRNSRSTGRASPGKPWNTPRRWRPHRHLRRRVHRRGWVSGVSTFVIGLIFSFYILLQKEKLSRHGRQVIYGLLPMEKADRTLEILRLANRTFSHFLSGQCLEACILGTLFAAAMTIFRMPYALLVGVLIALTALIPIVGAFIGCGVGGAAHRHR